MEKLDLKKELKHLYAPSSKKVEVVDIPIFNFALIDGQISPGETPSTSQDFGEAIGALYGVSYTLKFMSKLRATDPIDYTVMPLEGLWWTDSGEFDFNRQEDWKWTLMIMQPGHISEAMCQDAVRKVREKKDISVLSRLRFETFHEGLCLQTMHIGPYAEETHTIDAIKAFAQQHGYRVAGKHHEIYMGDPRRAKPEKLKTILRYPVETSD